VCLSRSACYTPIADVRQPLSSAFVGAFGDYATPHRQAIAHTVDYFRAHPRAK
jgi:hypothetical protein